MNLSKNKEENLKNKEEYMAMLTDETDKLYDIQFIRENLLNDINNMID